ncbi:MAG: GNAT family N-acetyltransferase [Proteobacteria bacterium]|nr:GNAT family N-acetyltransferase [Pseudomonadota bacterium]
MPAASFAIHHASLCRTAIGYADTRRIAPAAHACATRSLRVAAVRAAVTVRQGAHLSSETTTRFLTPSEYPHWTGLVATAPGGSVYALPDYLDALCTATGAKFRILVAERAGHIAGGIALYERPSRAGAYIAPRLLLYYNGIVLMAQSAQLPSQRTESDLRTLAALQLALTHLPHARIRFKNRAELTDLRIFAVPGWSITPTWTYEVDITDPQRTLERIDKNQRRLIRRCTEQGLVLTSDWDFDSLYRLHLGTHERKGAPVYLPREAFQAFVETLRNRGLCRLYQARTPDGRAIAVQLVLTGPHPVTHTVCVGGDAEAMRLGASPFLRWKVFEDLHAAGYRANDLTDAELNPVTRFKSQLGGELKLCLQVARSDRLAFRASEWAKEWMDRTKGLLSRTLRPLRGGNQS